MSRRVFLDVGGHLGETVAAVLQPRWRFDRVWTFEPATSCVKVLRQFADPRLEVVPAGWWTSPTTLALHDPGDIGASIVADKARSERVEQCEFIDCADWIRSHLRPDDEVWLKLNCEGAECDVIDHLVDQDVMDAVDHLLVHFDVEKVPSIAHRAERSRRRLADLSIDFVEARDILFGRSHAAKTANWLAWTEASGLARLRYSHLRKVTFRLRQRLYPLKVRFRQQSMEPERTPR